MADYTQERRKLDVDTPLGKDVLLLAGFSGREGISRLFSYQLEFLADSKKDADITFDKILGQKVTVHLMLPDDSKRPINGLCVKFQQGERTTLKPGDTKSFTNYRAEIVPDLWKLTRKTRSRIFQQMTVPDILKKVIGEYGLEVSYDLQGTFYSRDYCVQYRETDFNFVSRLMEEEGIYYYFQHADGSHTLKVSNNPTSHPSLPTGPTKIEYEPLAGGEREEDRITAWGKTQDLRSGKLTLWDHCFELPHKHLEATVPSLDSVQAGTATHKLKVGGNDAWELYDYPGEYAQRFDGIAPGGGDRPADLSHIYEDNQRTAGIRMQQEETLALEVQAESNARQLSSGFTFTLDKHFSGNGKYLITGLSQVARGGLDYRSGGADAFHYTNSFTCIPEALPCRPVRLTPRPFVQGPQTAVVVGPKGEEIFTDKYGRVKVQFHWDREGKNDENSSCWIRVGTPWAGQNWGAISIPRIGQEVIVAFQEGDPDQPLIVGSVFNADMMPPYDLPGEKTKSTLKSRSSMKGSSDNFNEIRFEDKKGSEEILVHAEKDLNEVVENNRTTTVGLEKKDAGDEKLTVNNNRDVTIGKEGTGNDTLTVKADRSATVGGNDSETVAKKQDVTIGENQSLTVGQSRDTTIAVNDSLTVGSSLTITCASGLSVTAGTNTTITTNILSITVGGVADITVGGAANISVGGAANVSAGGAVAVNAGGAISLSAAGAVAITATAITLTSAVVTCTGALVATSIVSPTYTPGVGNIV